jgi:hypothetical protein
LTTIRCAVSWRTAVVGEHVGEHPGGHPVGVRFVPDQGDALDHPEQPLALVLPAARHHLRTIAHRARAIRL